MPALNILFLFVSLALSVNSFANAQSNSLLKIKATAYEVSAAFSALVFFEGSPKFSAQLNIAIEQGNQIINSSKNTFPQIYQRWNKSILFIRENEQYVYAGEDRRLETSLTVLQNELYAILDQRLAEQDSSDHDAYLYVNLKLEKVLAQYMGFASASMGVFHSDETLEQSVMNFDSLLESAPNKNAAYKRLVRKWNFIKRGMLNQGGPTTPFLTLHTGAEIRKLLRKAYNLEA
jgi:hypothetical protein